MKIIRWILGRIILIIDFVTRPKKIIRSEEEQQKIDNTFSNHSIYQFHTCPFCVKVRRYLRKESLNSVKLGGNALSDNASTNISSVTVATLRTLTLNITCEPVDTHWLEYVEYTSGKSASRRLGTGHRPCSHTHTSHSYFLWWIREVEFTLLRQRSRSATAARFQATER